MNSLTISSQVSFWKIPNSSTLRDQQLIKDDPEIKTTWEHQVCLETLCLLRLHHPHLRVSKSQPLVFPKKLIRIQMQLEMVPRKRS